MKRLGFLALGLSTLVAGCSVESKDDFEPLPGDVCARQHAETTSDGYDVVVCEELYAEAPLVHLPKTEEGHAYAGIVGTGFVTADGASPSGGSIAPEDKRHGVALYEVELDGNRVTDYRPVLVFEQALLLKPFLGNVFEGTISRGAGEQGFVFEPSLPVRLKVLADAPTKAADGTYEARAVIENLDQAISGSDGSCLPALTSYGDEAPFAAGTTLEILLERAPSMHEFGDDHVLIAFSDGRDLHGSLMAAEWYRGPIDIVRNTLSPTGTYQGRGHGSPGSLPSVDLDPASGGGEACSE